MKLERTTFSSIPIHKIVVFFLLKIPKLFTNNSKGLICKTALSITSFILAI